MINGRWTKLSVADPNIIKLRIHVCSGDGLASVLLILVLVSITLCNISYLQMSSLTTIIAWRGRWRGARRAARSWTIAIIKMIIHNTATAAQQHHNLITTSPLLGIINFCSSGDQLLPSSVLFSSDHWLRLLLHLMILSVNDKPEATIPLLTPAPIPYVLMPKDIEGWIIFPSNL